MAITRARDETRLAFMNDVELSPLTFLKMGEGKVYDARRQYEGRLRLRQESTQRWLVDQIIAQDRNESKTFDGGCATLLAWYNSHQLEPNSFRVIDIL